MTALLAHASALLLPAQKVSLRTDVAVRNHYAKLKMSPLQHLGASMERDGIVVTSSKPTVGQMLTTATLCSMLVLNPMPTQAYDASDYASETVQFALQSVKDAAGKKEETLKAFENIAEIITEGKGVGGEINYQGVKLDRGYVSDEDTSIYNPGLTLLTESEKERLVEAVVDSRKAGYIANQWSDDNQAGFDFLRGSLDPYHMYELRGYLGFVPFYGAAVYLAVLAVQQLARPGFPTAYFAGVAAIFLPAIVLIALGPQ